MARSLPLLVAALAAAACTPFEPAPGEARQELEAMGEVVNADGSPASAVTLERYELSLFVDAPEGDLAAEDGSHRLSFTFDEDADSTSPKIVTDADGAFRIVADDLDLSYTYDVDAYECHDDCTEWATTCEIVDETVCTTTCEDVTVDVCWDECVDDCTTVCHDETVCDDSGCWVETVCEDQCVTSCETVCEPTTETQCYDDCEVVPVEECYDDCVSSVEVCDWVTHTYSAVADLSDVTRSEASIELVDANGAAIQVKGERTVGKSVELCDRSDTSDVRGPCDGSTRWLERDRFVLPAQ
ncbi:MAG: hypothetical protein U0271_13310 [Polyangiaceae bacterium]